jgi:seryl-tRNA synthetase
MLDIKYIRENAELIGKGAVDKRIKFDIDALIALDTAIRPLQTDLETNQSERNALSKTIGKAAPEDRDALKAQVSEIKAKMETINEDLSVKKAEFNRLMLLVPQPAREDVPVGKDDMENDEIKKWGTVPEFDFKVKDHVDLCESNGMLDVKRGVKIAGSRSYVLVGDGARLEQAIMRFTYDFLLDRGFTPLSVPVLVTEECMEGTGYFPTGKDQAYFIEEDKLALVGTSEVPLTSFHSNEMLKAEELPKKYFALSSCFRREAGTYGKDTRGLYRVHQFTKIEQVIIGPNSVEASEKFHQELLGNAEAILQALELPYRVVYVCTGDLGQGQLRKHDIETWMPSREAYSETHSCSTFHEFQTRRLKIRYKDKDGNKNFCHSLNNTAIASPRVLIPLIENHQTKDGKIKIPAVLQPYMGGKTEIG